MNREDELLQENRALRERLTRLSEANLRINESLDFDTVLQGVLDSARGMMRARYGVITLFNEAGNVLNSVSSGLSSEEADRMRKFEYARDLYDHFKPVREPLRIPDLLGYIGSLGLPEFPLPVELSPGAPILIAPILLRGEPLGHFFIVDKCGGQEFTQDDEDTLVLFVSQAAMVITNARRYRDEQRARTNLETLIDMSPVGVVVFDGGSGSPIMFNREAVRIIERLGNQDKSPEQLLEILTVKRADGREVLLEGLSMAQVLSSGETVRAEEVILQEPNGRSVTVLVNATPILSGEGEIETFVVTMQDMTPMEELEQRRAEFLAMVSHELRTPLATVRGSVSTLLDESSDLHPTEVRQFHRIIWEQTDRMRALITDLLDVAHIETGTLPVSAEPTDVASLAGEAGNAFRIGGYRHSLQIDVPADLPWVMADRSRMVQVLGNLLTNAARHSPESTTIRVSAVQVGLNVSVTVSDEGRGIPTGSLHQLFRKFSRIESEGQEGTRDWD